MLLTLALWASRFFVQLLVKLCPLKAMISCQSANKIFFPRDICERDSIKKTEFKLKLAYLL